MTFSKIASAALAATALVSVSATPALAQQAEAAQTGDYQFQLTEEHIVSFVDAAIAIEALVTEVQPQLQAASTQEEQAEIQEQAQARMTAIVTDSGLSVDEYNAIASAARENQSVAQRLRAEAQSRGTQ